MVNKPTDGETIDDQLLLDMRRLWGEVDAYWEKNLDEPEFEGYVSSDFETVLQALADLLLGALGMEIEANDQAEGGVDESEDHL